MTAAEEQLHIRDLREVHRWLGAVYELEGREPGRGEIHVWGRIERCRDRGPTWDETDAEYEIDYVNEANRRGTLICRGSTRTAP